MGCQNSTSIKPQTINVPGKYVIRRKVDGVWKEQYANITNKVDNSYEFEYGMVGFHEGNCKAHEIRELTDIEKQYVENNLHHKLPQQFYQSMPS